jgi:hypothetical protein
MVGMGLLRSKMSAGPFFVASHFSDLIWSSLATHTDEGLRDERARFRDLDGALKHYTEALRLVSTRRTGSLSELSFPTSC